MSTLSPVEPLAYSPAEAARVIGISRARLYELMAEGVVPSLKLGHRRLIRRQAIDQPLAELEAGEIEVPAG